MSDLENSKYGKNGDMKTESVSSDFGAMGGESAGIQGLPWQPDIHGDCVVFVQAGELWTCPTLGGQAERLTSMPGLKRTPKFSPNGQFITFSATVAGNEDVYVIPRAGGEPRRLTWHPSANQVVGWHPDGEHVLFRSNRGSFNARFNRLFLVPLAGGPIEPLALPEGEQASYNADGSKIVFCRESAEAMHWKKYRGGLLTGIWSYDFQSGKAVHIVANSTMDQHPMWLGRTIYFVSDRDENKKANLWACDENGATPRQITFHDEFDVKWPSPDPEGDRIVYENGGTLHLLDCRSGKSQQISVTVPLSLKPGQKKVGNFLMSRDISYDGGQVVAEVRGGLFVIPAGSGTARNLTRASKGRERCPRWSPDSHTIAYCSDETGEWQLYIRPAEGQGQPVQLTHEFMIRPDNLSWSPDGTKIAFSDGANTYYYVDVESQEIVQVFNAPLNYGENYVTGSWSPDGKWIAYAKGNLNWCKSIHIYSLRERKSYRLTDEFGDDTSPIFDPAGRYIYWISNRKVNLRFSEPDFNYQLQRRGVIVVAALNKNTPPACPWPGEQGGSAETSWKDGGEMAVDPDGLSERLVSLPVTDADYTKMWAFTDQLVYATTPDPTNPGKPGTLKLFDFREGKEKTILQDVSTHTLFPSGDGNKLLYTHENRHGVIDIKADQILGTGALDLVNLEMEVDLRKEWRQMFMETWRIVRDFVPEIKLRGVDWLSIRQRYESWLPRLAHRSDFDHLLGEMLGELGSSHCKFFGGGDQPESSGDAGGCVLAADFKLDERSGCYWIEKIYPGQNWDSSRTSPLLRPGLNVSEGSYLLAVNGKPLKAPDNPFALLAGTAGKPTVLTINATPSLTGSREITVEPLADDRFHRYLDWVQGNIDRVSQATGGRVGYIHLPDTYLEGHEWFNRLFLSQVDKHGLILDARFNAGGYPPLAMLERLKRPMLDRILTRHSDSTHIPEQVMFGPKICLVNQWAESGGDMLARFFQTMNIGPVIGVRTCGNIAAAAGFRLQDGMVFVYPHGAFANQAGESVVENEGVEPDIEEINAPDQLMRGVDDQLERGIAEILRQLDDK
ncbi:MAG: PDZ domain-containing protein [Candidatus Thermoplasmatota archaeon]|nr:PDZ domain-containing protein [Candidatus Thermoplasmatota archaeon]MBU4072083.1 PDZ domain-containing protein [Candidatus Thermoplasmatota archaeon]MBU4592533.1 PDZ domain-containing protein [Candidatus Thermoplasmatota archaeon]